MKKYNFVYEVLAVFGGTSILGLAVNSIKFGFDFNVGYQILLISIICVFLRYIFYSEEIIKGKSYTFRNICFFATFLPVLSMVAYFGEWLPMEPGAIIMFFIIFFVIGGVIATYFYFKLKKEGFQYTRKLNDFKDSHSA